MSYLPNGLVAIVIASAAFVGPVSANEIVPGVLTGADIPSAANAAVAAKSDGTVPGIDTTDAMGAGKDLQTEMAIMVGDSTAAGAPAVFVGSETQNTAVESDPVRDKEEVWTEISQAISGLNDMVGDEMFRDLRRTENNRMEVRVDLDYWQRVRYQTRVDLKNDISNIWHLYVLQYSDDAQSSVFFIDDHTDKTIDIFSKIQ